MLRDLFSDIRFRLRAIFRRGAVERELGDELRGHIDIETGRLIREGVPAAEAQRRAKLALGGIEQVKEATRDARGTAAFEALVQDVVHAIRGLRREPAFTAFIIVTLALGIGANAAMFGVIDRLLLRGAEHVRDSRQVMRLYATHRVRSGLMETSSDFGYITYSVARAETDAFADAAAYQVVDASIGSGASSQAIREGQATASFFPLLGVQPAIGRFFSADEDRLLGAQHVAVLGYGVWQRLFGGSQSVLGTSIQLDGGESFVVVGVAPKGFTGAELATVDVWTPMSLLSTQMADWATSWSWTNLSVITRLKPGITPAQANSALTAMYARVSPHGTAGDTIQLTVRPISYNEHGSEPIEARVATWLVAVAAVVLLVACANIISLQLARLMRRRREMAVRVALGAGRGGLMRLLLAEGMLLAAGGGAAALGVAYFLGEFLRRSLLTQVEWSGPPVDARVFLVTSGVALAAGAAVGLMPALSMRAPDLAAALKSDARTGSSARSQARTALMLAQAGFSVVLLIGAGLFIRSVRNVYALDLGVQADRVIAVTLNVPPIPGEPSGARAERRSRFATAAVTRVRQLPGIDDASLANGLPFRGVSGIGIKIPGRDSVPAVGGGVPRIQGVESHYFATVGTRILRGRPFTSIDETGSEHVAIVSDRLARAYWPNEDPLGKCFIIGSPPSPCARIVGIAENTYTRNINEEPGLEFFVPITQMPFGGITTLVARPRTDPVAMIGPVRRALLEIDSTLTHLNIATLEDAVDPQVRPWKLGAAVFALMGGLAVLVATAGLYSLLSYMVTQRAREISVRMALGADWMRVVGMIVRWGVMVCAGGTAIGVLLALLAGSYIAPLLFRTSPRDPVVFMIVAAVLFVVSVVATIAPAYRAQQIDPMATLRAE
jgi:predicted permease